MYKKEAATVVTILSGIWLDYSISHKLLFTTIVAFFIYGYWFMRMFQADYQKD